MLTRQCVSRVSSSCKAQFETDKVLGVTKEYIEIERTTWCAGAHTATFEGLEVEFHVAQALPAAPRAGDSVRFFVDPKRVTTRTDGKVVHVTVRDPIVTEVSIPTGYRYRWSQSLDWQLHQPFVGAKITRDRVKQKLALVQDKLAWCMRNQADAEKARAPFTVTLHFTIESSGAVSNVRAENGSDRAETTRCFASALEEVRFSRDAARAPMPVQYPLVHSP